MKQVLKFDFGGVNRQCKATIDLALQIEEATGRGLLDVGRDLLNDRAPLATALAIIRVALSSAGKVYTDKQIRDMASKDGIRKVLNTAAVIVAEFFKVPETEAGEPEPADAGNA